MSASQSRIEHAERRFFSSFLNHKKYIEYDLLILLCFYYPVSVPLLDFSRKTG